MARPDTNITEDGEPGDLASAATDEFGGSGEETTESGAGEIAADDAGGDVLGGNAGRTAGGLAELGVGGQSGPVTPDPGGAASIAADDAGAGRKVEQANGSGAD
jgi:hypothetical protein